MAHLHLVEEEIDHPNDHIDENMLTWTFHYWVNNLSRDAKDICCKLYGIMQVHVDYSVQLM